MKLIIDGYNLIKKNAQIRHISAGERNSFLQKLGIYAKNKNLQLIVVFDGGQASFNYHEKIYGIEVIYSGFLETADDVINRYIQSYNSQEELLIISSDREIINFAISSKIDVLKSEDFYDLVQASKLEAKPLVLANYANKTTKINNLELDELMEQASRQIKAKKEPEVIFRKSNTQKTSKQERQKLRKLKKL